MALLNAAQAAQEAGGGGGPNRRVGGGAPDSPAKTKTGRIKGAEHLSL